MATLFKDVFILDGEREHAQRGHILVSKGRIQAVTDTSDVPPAADKIVEGRGHMAVLPGFVNAHTHAAMVLLRGLGEELPLMEWLQKKIWPVEANLTLEHVYWGTASAILEMLATGTTCFTDMYSDMDGVAGAALEAGMRAALCRGIISGPSVDGVSKIDRCIEENLALFERWHGREGLLTVQLGPHSPYTVPLEDMKKIVGIAKERGIGVHFHFLETEWELGYIGDELKMTPEKYLSDIGILEIPGTILAHGVWMAPALADSLDMSNVTVAHCPCSNMKLGSGVMPLDTWLDKNVGLAIGTDGASSNNRLDMWTEMRSAALLHKGVTRNPTSTPAIDILRMATLEGARASGFANKGLIREGWVADLVLVDLDQPHYVGVSSENLVNYIIYAGSSGDVRGTMVNGKWLYKDGIYPGLDKDEILRKTREARKAILILN